MKRYSFKIQIKPFSVKSPYLETIRRIYVSNICIVAKNSKEGGIYLSNYAKIIQGRFFYVAGSVRYPILVPKGHITIKVKDFPFKPCFTWNHMGAKEYINYLSITDIQEYDTIS